LRDALENPLRVDNLFIERSMTRYGERLFVLGSQEPLEDDLDFPASAVDPLIEVLREQFHYVVVDVPRRPSAIARRVLEIADTRAIVVDQTLQAVRDAARLGRLDGLDGGEHRDVIVVNRKGEAGRRAVRVDEVAGALEQRLGCIVPFQPALFATAAAQGIVPVEQKGRFADAIGALATEISGQRTQRISRWRLFR